MPTYGRMRILRLALMCLAAIAAATLVSGCRPREEPTKPAAAPSNLRGFLLRPNESVTHVFPRTPAFAWAPVRGRALLRVRARHEPQLQRELDRLVERPLRRQAGRRLRGRRRQLGQRRATAPATGSTAAAGRRRPARPRPPPRIPQSRHDPAAPRPGRLGRRRAARGSRASRTRCTPTSARSRTQGPTGWSKPFAFNMRWPSVPTPLPTQPGLVRWTPRPGRDGLPGLVPDFDVSKVFSTTHERRRPARVLHLACEPELVVDRALARPRRAPRLRRHPERPPGDVSYGPWSPMYTATNPDTPRRQAAADSSRSRIERATRTTQSAHELMPAFTFTGDQGLDGVSQPVPVVPRLRLDRPRLRQRRLPRRRRRKPGLRAAHERDRSSCRSAPTGDRRRRSGLGSRTRTRGPTLQRPTVRHDRRARAIARQRAGTAASGRGRRATPAPPARPSSVPASTSPTSTSRRPATTGRSSR